MNSLTLSLLLPLTVVAVLLSFAGCANTERSATSDGLFEDPTTKRLQMQEDMTKMAREISENY